MIVRSSPIRFTLLGLALAACSRSAEHTNRELPPVSEKARPTSPDQSSPPSATSPAMQSTLAVKLLASPTQLTMADRPKFMIGVEVVNNGATAVDPNLSTGCELTVNGAPSMAWNLAIGNGAREPSWYSLPPGQTATMSWPLGEELFPKPGNYHLVMTLDGRQSTADVHVTR
jgi:hypothetical protein